MSRQGVEISAGGHGEENGDCLLEYIGDNTEKLCETENRRLEEAEFLSR